MTWMRQKPEAESTPSATPTATQTPTPRTNMPNTSPATPPNKAKAPAPRQESGHQVVNVGKSVQIKGELTGNEDLVIEGTVDGQIKLPKHRLTIGSNARINAGVSAKTVLVLGQVSGNIVAEDVVDISPSGSVHGDITAPRVSIADGARFNGAINMVDEPASSSARPKNETSPTQAQPKKDMAIAG